MANPRDNHKRLTAAEVARIDKPGNYGDGGRGSNGLHLIVTATGSKKWHQRIRFNGRITNWSLGDAGKVTLAQARAKAAENKQLVADGLDPRKPRRGKERVPTFADCIEPSLAHWRGGWKPTNRASEEREYRQCLADYCRPILRFRINDIDQHEIAACLAPHWSSKHKTMLKTLTRVKQVFDWAVLQELLPESPALNVKRLLPKVDVEVQHHEALPHSMVAGAIAKVKAAHSVLPAAKLAFEFMVLTATRSSEVRGAAWAEIDLEAKVWTIPKERMKAAKPHRVPLSTRAIAILEAAKGMHPNLVFPSAKGLEMREYVIGNRLLPKLGIKAKAHGFRSSFRDWGSEKTDASHDALERALAHGPSNGVEAAYHRTDLLDQRAALMQAWADYLAQ